MIIVKEINIESYETVYGKILIKEWFMKLDDQAQLNIKLRIRRMARGNFGHCDPIGSGLMEIKFYESPGYRIYYGKIDASAILLLCAGNKSTQSRDIEKAKLYWQDFKQRGIYERKKQTSHWFDEL